MMFLDPTIPGGQLTLAVSILVGTFVYEDGATVLAATLAASGRLHPGLGLVAAFTGIWMGDIGLFMLGSSCRRLVERSRRLRRLLSAGSISRAQVWLAERGSWALVMSRAIPGSRLPLYLAAGALKFSFYQFVKVTGFCAAVWVSLIFVIWRIPSHQMKWMPWTLTGMVLLGPWVLRRVVSFKRAEGRSIERQNRAISACAA